MQALVGGLLIDGTGNDPLENACVLIEEKVISQVGPKDQIEIPEKCHIIEVGGKTIMPGMMDLHVHFSLAEDDVLAPQAMLPPFFDKPLTFLGVRGYALARRAMEMGFTTLRGCGDIGWLDVSIRNAIEAGLIEGPRVLASGQFLTPTGGHWDFLPEWLSRHDIASNLADGVDGVRQAVRRQVKMRTNWVKFCATGGIMNAYEKTFNFTQSELEALMDEAHSKGLFVAAHCIHHKGTSDAVKAGVDSVEHGTMLTEEIIELMLKNGTTLVPTLYAPCAVVDRGAKFGLPDVYIDKCRPISELHIKSFQMALKAGVHIACGSDAGMTSVVHGTSAYELELLVKYGMTPMQAIITATSGSASAARLDEKLGSIEKGKLADIVVVKGDPLEDIRILQKKQNIEIVMKEGNLLVNRMLT